MEVTFRPVILSSRPVEEAEGVHHWVQAKVKREIFAGERTDYAFPNAADDTSRDKDILHDCERLWEE